MVSEQVVQSYILEKLNEIPFSEWVKPTTTNKAGTQDILGHIRGYYIAIEVKRNDEDKNDAVPSKLQRYRIAETNRKGGFSFWTNSWKDALAHLHSFARTKGFDLYNKPARDYTKKKKISPHELFL